MTPRGAALRRGAVAFVLTALAAAGCGGGGSKSTGSGTPRSATPANFDFGSNNPLRATAFGDSITLGELGDPGLTRRGLGLRSVTSRLVTTNNYPNNLQNMLRGLDPGWRVINRGVGGETTAGGAARLPGVLAADRPGFVLIMEGTNDASRELDPASIVGNLDSMVSRAQESHTVPVLGTIPPNFRNDPGAQAVIDQANAMLRTLARSRGVVLAEIFDGMNDRSLFGSPDQGINDPLHPNEQGYVRMAGIWFDAMQRAIPAATTAGPVQPVGGTTPALSKRR
jgi:lysophospholipase L1-like esterase